MDLTAHKQILSDFANEHLTGNPGRDRFIHLKLEHSLRVHENGRDIAAGEGFDARTTDICNLASLFHDIGRFPQFARYGTFNDRESVNHGRMGVRTLREISLPEDMTKQDMRIVRLAIGQHNIKSIRPDLAEPYAVPVKLVRDADKIDIYRVMLAHFSGEDPDPVVTHGFEDIPDKYTIEIYQDVMNGVPGDYSMIRYANDFKLLLVGWLKFLYFPTSLEILTQRGSIDGIFSFLPKDDKIEALRENVDTFIRYNSQSPS